MKENPEYPGMYDTAQQETDDLLHDYYEMLDYAGDPLFDPLIVEYREELEKRYEMYRGIRVIEHDDGYTIPDSCWFFATWELLKHYIDSELIETI